MLGIIQDEHSECADGARLHHLGEYDSEPLLKHHAALAQLIAGMLCTAPAPASADIGAAAVRVGERACENGKCTEVSSDRVL